MVKVQNRLWVLTADMLPDTSRLALGARRMIRGIQHVVQVLEGLVPARGEFLVLVMTCALLPNAVAISQSNRNGVRHPAPKPVPVPRISQYDELIQKHAKSSDIDWRLVSSIIAAESSFRPRVVSRAGAQGLMQIMPVVAREHGVKGPKQIFNPDINIQTGIQHFSRGFTRIKGETERDALSLSLAAYNAGLGHLRDAQVLAKRLGLNPRKWSDVKQMLLKLQHRKYYESVRYGYVRGRETVYYVYKVLRFYDDYKKGYPKNPKRTDRA